MKYDDKIFRTEGIISEVHDGCVYIDIKERHGSLRIPKRMIFCDAELKVGQHVAWCMSYPEQLAPEPDERYLKSLEITKANRLKYQKRAKEIKAKDEY